jgi:hypothetical protein
MNPTLAILSDAPTGKVFTVTPSIAETADKVFPVFLPRRFRLIDNARAVERREIAVIQVPEIYFDEREKEGT